VDRIESVTLGVNKRAWHESGSEPAKWDPQTRETADHSIPYLFARALVDGVIDETSFEPNKITDPAIRELMKKVQVVVDPGMEAQRPKLVLGCRAEVVDADGDTHCAHIDGIPGDDTTWLSRDQIAEKFRRLTASYLGDNTSRAFDAVWDSAAVADFQQVLAVLRA
jgi:2-methylcitrate dehydratase